MRMKSKDGHLFLTEAQVARLHSGKQVKIWRGGTTTIIKVAPRVSKEQAIKNKIKKLRVILKGLRTTL
jgi:hypothetical protein